MRALHTGALSIFSVRQHGDVRVINVEHDLDICSSGSLASAIRLAGAVADRRLIVSLEDCNFCDASALAVLLGAKAALGARLSIVVPTGRPVRRVFEITNTAQRLSLFANLNEALATASG
jgi:anti-anti-sigma factor